MEKARERFLKGFLGGFLMDFGAFLMDFWWILVDFWNGFEVVLEGYGFWF